MKYSKMFIMTLAGLAFIYLANCTSDKTLQFEKEKIRYSNQIDSVLSKIERKLADLKAEYKQPDEMKPNRIEEFAKPKIEVDSLEQTIIQLERIEERLNQKQGELQYVKEDQWHRVKSEIDLLLDEYRKL